jgi:diguanylate cyclase (GGDEF)-like protein
MKLLRSKTSNIVFILVSFLFVSALDYVTGNEIRLYPLYFLPIAKAAYDFGKKGAILSSVFASIIWVIIQYYSGRVYSSWIIWVINFASQGVVFLIVSMLVARLRDSLVKANSLSLTDSLTGLFNSRALYELANKKLNDCHLNKHSVVMAYIDLDNFKAVNDTLGHDQGDLLLRKVAQLFKNNIRPSDLVARMGGDEFVIFLAEIDSEAATGLLEKVREEIHQIPDFEGLNISASIGAVAYLIAPTDLQQIISQADKHMFSVKKSGKNRVHLISI